MRRTSWLFAKPVIPVSLRRVATGGDRDIERGIVYIESIKGQPFVLEVWNERLWVGLLEKATVFHDGRMVFEFKNGTGIEVEL